MEWGTCWLGKGWDHMGPTSGRVGARRGAGRVVAAAVAVALTTVVAPACTPGSVKADRRIVFPVAGDARFVDSFGAPRSGGRTHQGQDLMAAKMTPVVATVDGRVTRLRWDNTGLSGNSLTITDAQGWTYVYIHLNNDTPGTDDGSNRYERAFADGIVEGQRVRAGEVVGYVGDSGNAELAGSHLHFELHRPDGSAVNPYASLVAAQRFRRSEAQRLADSPAGVFETVSRVSGAVRVVGWAIDAHRDDPVRITVLVDGNPAATGTAASDRPTLAPFFPGRGTRHGFSLSGVPAAKGAKVCVIAHSIGGGGSSRLGCRTAP